MDFKLGLFTLSKLEVGRIPEPRANPSYLSPFDELNRIVHASLTPTTKLIQKRTPLGNPLLKPKTIQRPIADEGLIERILKARDRMPLSTRVIRTEKT